MKRKKKKVISKKVGSSKEAELYQELLHTYSALKFVKNDAEHAISRLEVFLLRNGV